jgi:hypothetical protein
VGKAVSRVNGLLGTDGVGLGGAVVEGGGSEANEAATGRVFIFVVASGPRS